MTTPGTTTTAGATPGAAAPPRGPVGLLAGLVGLQSFGRPGWVLPPVEMQDLAKLVFATSIVWMYFFWSQYLVIWYGNIPVETKFVIQRFFNDPWRFLAFVIFGIGWLIPFTYLLKRLTGRPPARHGPLVFIACLALIAIFLERMMLVFPSVTTERVFPFGLSELLITAGFFALFLLSRVWFLARYRPQL